MCRFHSCYIQYASATYNLLVIITCILFLGVFRFPEKPCPGGRVYAMASTGEVEKRVWVATSVSKNHPVSNDTAIFELN